MISWRLGPQKALFAWLVLHEFLSLGIQGFVKQLLKGPPVLDRKELWRRSEYNVAKYGNFSLTLTRSLEVPTPSYVQILQDHQLTITSFSLLRKGSIMEIDLNGITSPKTYVGDFLWPNELSTYREKTGEKILLVPDGFLMPGQNDGGIYAIPQWGSKAASKQYTKQPIRLTIQKEGWFYHRAMYVKLNGQEGILTARAQKSPLSNGKGELVWLHLPPTSLSSVALPLEEVVLMEGPDVMFDVVDLNKGDDCIEIVSAHFFGRELSLHSLRPLPHPPYVQIIASTKIETVGRPYGLCFATFSPQDEDEEIERVDTITRPSHIHKVNRYKYKRKPSKKSSKCSNHSPTHLLVTTHECSYDLPSALHMAVNTLQGEYPKVKTQKMAYGTVVTSNAAGGEGLDPSSPNTLNGGSLIAYELPRINTNNNENDKEDSTIVHKEKALDISNWKRTTLFKGFKVRGWGGIFSPGAPGFPYVFRMPNKPQSPPLILLAGDCTGSAYLFAPKQVPPRTVEDEEESRTVPKYELAYEIECGATVGSAAVEGTGDDSGDVNLYIPAYELNKVHVFRLTDLEPHSKQTRDKK